MRLSIQSTCLFLLSAERILAFQNPTLITNQRMILTRWNSQRSPILLNMAKQMTNEELKSELATYLKKRDAAKADESAQNEIGKVIGGTKGNKVLEYISGSPNKSLVIEEAPDIFDYGELSKYGYSNLVTPIMDAGGRREMYNLMGLPMPAVPDRIKNRKKFQNLSSIEMGRMIKQDIVV